MKKVIFTADDFGVYDQIDNAVIQAVEAGKINSVAVFANGFGLETGIRRLKEAATRAGTDLQIGCHLTFCSGKPLTKLPKNFVDGGYFRKFHDMRRDDLTKKDEELEALRGEINAQIELLRNITAIDHLSSHHNTLSWFEDYFDVYLDIAHFEDIPVRSPLLTPLNQFNRYQRMMGVVNYRLINKRRTLESYSAWRKKYNDGVRFYTEKYKTRHPSAGFTGHFGPLPIMLLRDHDIDGQISIKNEALSFAIETHAEGENDVEIILHLIEDNFKKKHKTRGLLKKGWYPGVDYKYVDGRMAEMRSLMHYSLPEGVGFGRWRRD